MPTTAFVAGATGYTGREVVRQLAAQGIHTLAHIRPDSSGLAKWRPQFEAWGAEVVTVPWDKETLQDVLATHQPAFVFSLLGTTKARGRRAAKAGRPSEDYTTVDYGLTVMLLEALTAIGSDARFVYLSSVGVTPQTNNAYLQARAKAEHALQQSGLPYTIARPATITGPDRDEPRFVEKLATGLGEPILAVVGALGGKSIRQRYRATTNTDLAHGLIKLALDPEAKNQTVESEALQALRPSSAS